MVGLLGLNGAGKTTLLKVLSGLHPTFRTEGICFHGHPIQLRGQGFKRCRYTVFAEDHAFPYFTFREYLAYVFRAYRKTCPDVTELVQGFHFADFADVLLKDLSTGNRKKAFLITAFALKPELLLLGRAGQRPRLFPSTEYLYQQIPGLPGPRNPAVRLPHSGEHHFDSGPGPPAGPRADPADLGGGSPACPRSPGSAAV